MEFRCVPVRSGSNKAITMWEQQGEKVKIPLTFAPHETFLVVFGKGEDGEHFDGVNYQGPYPPDLTYNQQGFMFLQPGAYQLRRGNGQIMWKQQVEEHPIQGAWDVKFEGMDMNVPFSDLISWHESDDTAIRY